MSGFDYAAYQRRRREAARASQPPSLKERILAVLDQPRTMREILKLINEPPKSRPSVYYHIRVGIRAGTIRQTALTYRERFQKGARYTYRKVGCP